MKGTVWCRREAKSVLGQLPWILRLCLAMRSARITSEVPATDQMLLLSSLSRENALVNGRSASDQATDAADYPMKSLLGNVSQYGRIILADLDYLMQLTYYHHISACKYGAQRD